MSLLTEYTSEAVRELAASTRRWRTKSGHLLRPTTRISILSALTRGFEEVTGSPAPIKKEFRLAKRDLLRHIRRQAVPLTKEHLRRVLRDTSTSMSTRRAILFCWLLALRAGDLRHIQRKDVVNRPELLTHLHNDAIIRMRGVKGSRPGARGYYRILPLVGLASQLKRIILRQTPTSGLVFETTRTQIVRALKKIDPQYSAHSIRRGAATFLATAGVSTRHIRDHLGHQTTDSTRIYIAPNPNQKDLKRRAAMATLLL